MGVRVHKILKTLEEKGLPEYVMYKEAGLSKSEWLGLFNGKAPVRAVVLAQIAKYLGLSLDDVFVLTDEDERQQQIRHERRASYTKKNLNKDNLPSNAKSIDDHKGNHFKSLKELAAYYNLPYFTLLARIRKGWDVEKAVTTKVISWK